MITRIVIAGAKGMAPIDAIAAAAAFFPEDIPHEPARSPSPAFYNRCVDGRRGVSTGGGAAQAKAVILSRTTWRICRHHGNPTEHRQQ